MSEEIQFIPDLDNEQLDALRLEVESQSPAEKERYKQIVQETHHRFIEKYGEYIALPNSDEDAGRRFLTTDKKNLPEFNQQWIEPTHPLGTLTYAPLETAQAIAYDQAQGRFVIGLPTDKWPEIGNRATRQHLINKYGSKEEAARALNELFEGFGIAHETAHLYENPLLPLWLKEAGAHWYAQELYSDKIVPGDIENFYQSLVDRYGSIVHDVYFGKDTDTENISRIMREFTPEVQQRIFPNYAETKLGNTE